MLKPQVLVVGAGLAGLATAVELARAGIPVRVVDQAPTLGGAIHRQPLPGIRSMSSSAQSKRWSTVIANVETQSSAITFHFNTRFGGIDHSGAALLTGAHAALIRPRAIVLALGATEAVQPRPGWTLPGVMTAGAIQTRIKTIAEPPAERVILAGSGPLLLAVGAELCRLGRPPIAIIEASRPLSHLSAFRLPLNYLVEAAGYLVTLLQARVPLIFGAHLTQISKTGEGLVAEVETNKGMRHYRADIIGLHDGIRPNDTGITESNVLPILRAGDCREALGARGAWADGVFGGQTLAASLLGLVAPLPSREIKSERAAQNLLAKIYAHKGATRLSYLPVDTIICRCENRSLGYLLSLGTAPTDRELRLDGRFGIGSCQGRFCAEWVRKLKAPLEPAPRIGAARWPTHPIAIDDFLAAFEDSESKT